MSWRLSTFSRILMQEYFSSSWEWPQQVGTWNWDTYGEWKKIRFYNKSNPMRWFTMKSTYLNYERNVLEHHSLQYLQVLGLFHPLSTLLNTYRLDLAIELLIETGFPKLHPLVLNVFFQRLNMYRWSDIQPKITLKGFEIVFCN